MTPTLGTLAALPHHEKSTSMATVTVNGKRYTVNVPDDTPLR
jgi:hypothetical protein